MAASFETTNMVVLSLNPTVDMSTKQYHFALLDSTGGCKLPTAPGQTAIGIIQNQPSVGGNAAVSLPNEIAGQNQIPAVIAISGISRVAVFDAYPAGTYIAPLCNAVTADAGLGVTSDASNVGVRAMMLQASAAKGDIVACYMLDPKCRLDSTATY